MKQEQRKSTKISIIIPVFNAQKHIHRCLDSLTNQTFKDIEIICVNDGSTDSTSKILEDYAKKDNRIKILNRKNSGAAISRNEGYKLAQGEYIQFLDADDFFESNMLEEMYNLAIENNADVAVCDHHRYDEIKNEVQDIETPFQRNIKTNQVLSAKDYPDDILSTTFLAAWTKLIKKEHIDKYNIQFQDLKCCNDNTFSILSILLAEKIVLINKKYVYYSINVSESISSSRAKYATNIIDAMISTIDTLKKHKKYEASMRFLYNIYHRSFKAEYKNCTALNKLKFELKLFWASLKTGILYIKLSPTRNKNKRI